MAGVYARHWHLCNLARLYRFRQRARRGNAARDMVDHATCLHFAVNLAVIVRGGAPCWRSLRSVLRPRGSASLDYTSHTSVHERCSHCAQQAYSVQCSGCVHLVPSHVKQANEPRSFCLITQHQFRAFAHLCCTGMDTILIAKAP